VWSSEKEKPPSIEYGAQEVVGRFRDHKRVSENNENEE
jgi:hypothetical protein